QYQSLKAQLKLLNVDVEKIEKGDFAQYFYLTAPISGTVTRVNANAGIYVNPGTYVFEIVNDKQLNLELNVLEKDLARVEKGQKIVFQTLNSNKIFEAKVERIGGTIDDEERSAKVFATVENPNQQFISGMYINAKIRIEEKNVYALPEDAILEDESRSMVFIEKDNQYINVAVTKGITQDGFCEVIEPDQQILDYPVVIKGGYYLQSVLEITE
ncbi:MAG: efflux RND transporter periplasmic adaptor subunit, partial [Bacteroidota bacterium]